MIPSNIRPNSGGFAVSEDPSLGRLLSALAASSEPVTGRVLGQAGDGVYLFTIRGRTLVAASDIPLAADQTVQVQASTGSDGTVRLRLIPDGAGTAGAAADPVAARLAGLGLADNGATRAALAAFAEAGAPLDRERLARAAAAIAYAADSGEPPADVVARAYATLARAGWPASPPAVALAVRAAEQRLPNLAAALQALAEPLADLPEPTRAQGDLRPLPPGSSPSPPGALVPAASQTPAPTTPSANVVPRAGQPPPAARVSPQSPSNPHTSNPGGGELPLAGRMIPPLSTPSSSNPGNSHPGGVELPLAGRMVPPLSTPSSSNPGNSNPGGVELPLAGRMVPPLSTLDRSNSGGGELSLAGRMVPPSNPGAVELPSAGRSSNPVGVDLPPAGRMVPPQSPLDRPNPGGVELPLAGRMVQSSNPGGSDLPLTGRGSNSGGGELPLAGRQGLSNPGGLPNPGGISNPGGVELPLAGRMTQVNPEGVDQPPAGHLVPSPPGSGALQRTMLPGAPQPAPSPVPADRLDPLRRLSAVLADLPDAATGGAPAVLRAFALAGLRAAAVLAQSAPATPDAPRGPQSSQRSDAPSVPAPILASLAATTTAGPDPEPAPGARRGGDPVAPLPIDLAPAVARAAREAAAETVFKPQHLNDYDAVLALPMLAQGQPTPARLAVAARAVPGGGKAYWLRVDAELSSLGPVSVRLSGADHGPMAITIVASRRAGAGIVDGLDDLVHDLDGLGLAAGVRVVDGDAETWRGA